MLIMPILNKRKGNVKIYNVEVRLKNATKVKSHTELKNNEAGDIIVNGSSFNNSIYNTKHKEPNSTVNFIRSVNYRSEKRDFLITTKKDSNSNSYDLYNVDIPPRKVTAGLDNLFGSALLDMKSEIPNRIKGKYVSLKKLGIDNTLTDEKIEKLKYIMENEQSMEKINNSMKLNGIGDLSSTIDYLNHFTFTIIDSATIKEEDFNTIYTSFLQLNTRDTKNLTRYYDIATENKEVYAKLTKISKILYNKPINLIKTNKNTKVLVKTKDDKYV